MNNDSYLSRVHMSNLHPGVALICQLNVPYTPRFDLKLDTRY